MANQANLKIQRSTSALQCRVCGCHLQQQYMPGEWRPGPDGLPVKSKDQTLVLCGNTGCDLYDVSFDPNGYQSVNLKHYLK